MIIWTPTVLSVLYACVLYFCNGTCSAQLSIFLMERCSRNALIIIISIIIIIFIIIIIVVVVIINKVALCNTSFSVLANCQFNDSSFSQLLNPFFSLHYEDRHLSRFMLHFKLFGLWHILSFFL